MGYIRNALADRRFFLFELGVITIVALDRQFWSHQHYQLRIFLCIAAVFYIGIASITIGLHKKNLGLVAINWLVSLQEFLLPVIMLFVLLIGLKVFWPSLFELGIRYHSVNDVIYRLLAYIVISVPVQELIFRGYVVNRLEQFSTDKTFVVLVSTFIFSAIHWPFGSLLMTVGSFVFGIFLSHNFIKFRNLYSVIIIHSILGIAVTLLTIQLY